MLVVTVSSFLYAACHSHSRSRTADAMSTSPGSDAVTGRIGSDSAIPGTDAGAAVTLPSAQAEPIATTGPPQPPPPWRGEKCEFEPETERIDCFRACRHYA